MIRPLFLIAFCLLAGPVAAADYVIQFSAHDGLTAQQTAVQFFKDIGQWEPASTAPDGTTIAAHPITSGELPGRHASWFMNLVGTVPGRAGLWLRWRWNGPIPAKVRAMVIDAIGPGVTVYPPQRFLADGTTPDPTYTQPPIGVIQ